MADKKNDISDEELARYKTAFEHFDKNGNGKMNAGDLRKAMKALGMQATEEEVADMLLGVNKVTLRFEDFCQVMGDRTSSERSKQREVRRIFQEFDRNGDGLISKKELTKAMRKLDKSLAEEEIDNIVKRADRDNDGQINYEEFASALV